jgi:hypothetical protein
MKKCPKCKQIFSEDYAFCLEDGETLVFVGTEDESLETVNVNVGEFETQILPHSSINSAETLVNPTVRPTGSSTNSSGYSKWLYVIFGVMTAIIAVLAISFYVTRTTPLGETANSDQAAKTNPANALFKPSGVWIGAWSSEKGGFSEAEMTLNDEGANQISGFIVWTLRRSVNPNKSEKVGMKAVEYVQGTYDPLTRVISVTGYEKKDPNDLIVLDSYKLSLSENNNKLRGSTRNQGKWSGTLKLERAK